MEESRFGVAVLEDIDAEIFAAFCEFAYTGTYDTTFRKSLTQYPQQSNQKVWFSNPDYEDWRALQAAWLDTDERYHEKDKYGDLELCLEYRDFSNREFQEDFRRIRPIHTQERISPLVFYYFVVKVYVFATKYLIEPLRQFCLAALHERLREYECDEFDSNEVLELLEYTYASTSNEEPTGPSLMRDLVIHYVACRFTILSKNGAFTRLLKSNAEIGTDLCIAMMKWKCKRAD